MWRSSCGFGAKFLCIQVNYLHNQYLNQPIACSGAIPCLYLAVAKLACFNIPSDAYTMVPEPNEAIVLVLADH